MVFKFSFLGMGPCPKRVEHGAPDVGSTLQQQDSAPAAPWGVAPICRNSHEKKLQVAL